MKQRHYSRRLPTLRNEVVSYLYVFDANLASVLILDGCTKGEAHACTAASCHGEVVHDCQLARLLQLRLALGIEAFTLAVANSDVLLAPHSLRLQLYRTRRERYRCQLERGARP
jgi:hypothetical protein